MLEGAVGGLPEADGLAPAPRDGGGRDLLPGGAERALLAAPRSEPAAVGAEGDLPDDLRVTFESLP
jgi:hypothetical protein